MPAREAPRRASLARPPALKRVRPAVGRGELSYEALIAPALPEAREHGIIGVQEDDGFVDEEFTPMLEQQRALGIVDGTARMPKKWAPWLRATKLFPEGASPVVFDSISPCGILQGTLGDCWLLASIAALAEFPAYLPTLFGGAGHRADGRYEVSLYNAVSGAWETIVIDDRVPSRSSASGPTALFAKPHNNELYVILIEKAFAKLAGSYSRLRGGCSLRAWLAMTGSRELEMWKRHEGGQWTVGSVSLAAEHLTLSDWRSVACFDDGSVEGDAFFETLHTYRANNFLMTAGIWGSSARRDDGLVSNHFYSLLAVVDRQDRGKRLRLLLLRNPWGTEYEWQGGWADGSKKWEEHPALARELPRQRVCDRGCGRDRSRWGRKRMSDAGVHRARGEGCERCASE